MRHGKKWTPSERRKALFSTENGLVETARALGRSPTAVARMRREVMNSMGIAPTQTRYRQGYYTLQEAADHLGFAPQTVMSVAGRNGYAPVRHRTDKARKGCKAYLFSESQVESIGAILVGRETYHKLSKRLGMWGPSLRTLMEEMGLWDPPKDYPHHIYYIPGDVVAEVEAEVKRRKSKQTVQAVAVSEGVSPSLALRVAQTLEWYGPPRPGKPRRLDPEQVDDLRRAIRAHLGRVAA